MNAAYPASLPEHFEPWYGHEDFFSDRPLDYVRVLPYENYAIDMHAHNFYELNIVTGGTGAHYIEQQMVPVGRGNVFVIPPNVRHGYYQEKGLDVFHILLNTRFMDDYESSLRGLPGFVGLFSVEPALRANGSPERLFLRLDDRRLETLMRHTALLLETCSGDYAGRYVQANGLMLYILGLLSGWYSPLGAPASSRPQQEHYRRIIHSMETIQTDFGRRLTIDALARQCGLSRSSYIRHFRTLFRCSPGEYLIDYRLKKAKELLVSTRDTVTDIALRCGFYDSSHFVRMFESAEGLSPRQYRLRETPKGERIV